MAKRPRVSRARQNGIRINRLRFLDSGSGEQEVTGRIGGARHLGLDLDDFDSVIRNGAHLRGHTFTSAILQSTLESSRIPAISVFVRSEISASDITPREILCRRWIGGAPRHPAAVFRGFGRASQERANAAPTPESASPRNLGRSACAHDTIQFYKMLLRLLS